MATFLFANNAATTLAGPISNTATTCNLAAGSGVLFPQPGTGQYFAMTFLDAATRTVREIVYVTAVSGDTLTITRAQENTAAGTWNTGDIAANLVTAGTLNAFAQSANLASSFFQGTDNGSDANNVVVPSTTPTNNAPTAGQIFVVTKGAQANTNAVTLRIPSAGTQGSVVYADGSALASGDWPGNSTLITRLLAGGVYQVLTRLIIPPPPTTTQINTLAGVTNRQMFWGAPGTYTFTVPAANQANGTTTLIFGVLGGGGAGGASGTGAGGGISGNGGGGGGGGAYCERTVSGLTPGSTITVTIGAGGLSVGNGNGGNGGSSSFGSYGTAGGGLGGAWGNQTYSTIGLGGTATGGDRNDPGQDGGASNSNSGTLTTSDVVRTYVRGGAAAAGYGFTSLSGSGNAGGGHGAGGCGATGGSGLSGGNGAPGYGWVRW